VIGHSLYNSVFLERTHSQRFHELRPYVITGQHTHERKAAVILSEAFGERLKPSVPIRALVLARVDGQAIQSRFRSASKGEALLGLGPSCLFQIPSRGAGSFPKLTELASEIPAFHLDLGSALTSIPPAVEEILQKTIQIPAGSFDAGSVQTGCLPLAD
jgi:hypothetical protein